MRQGKFTNDRRRSWAGTSRNTGLAPQNKTRIQKPILHFNDSHYLDISFDFYPCQCQTNRQLTVKLALRCHDCLMSPQSRISHMRTKI